MKVSAAISFCLQYHKINSRPNTIKNYEFLLGKFGDLYLERKLENWLAQRSLAQILDWFDCIETTKVQTVMGSYRWSTESVARDRLL